MTTQGATHKGDFYGDTTYYKCASYQHLNQVSEEWQTLYKWYFWCTDKWIPVGSGFSSRRLEELK